MCCQRNCNCNFYGCIVIGVADTPLPLSMTQHMCCPPSPPPPPLLSSQARRRQRNRCASLCCTASAAIRHHFSSEQALQEGGGEVSIHIHIYIYIYFMTGAHAHRRIYMPVVYVPFFLSICAISSRSRKAGSCPIGSIIGLKLLATLIAVF